MREYQEFLQFFKSSFEFVVVAEWKHRRLRIYTGLASTESKIHKTLPKGAWISA